MIFLGQPERHRQLSTGLCISRHIGGINRRVVTSFGWPITGKGCKVSKAKPSGFVHIRVTAETHKWLKIQAAQHGISMAEAVARDVYKGWPK